MASETDGKYFAVPGEITTPPGDGKNESHDEDKKVSPFCDKCTAFDYLNPLCGPGLFMDRLGLIWYCKAWNSCQHSIIVDGRIHSCRVRSQQIKDINRGRV